MLENSYQNQAESDIYGALEMQGIGDEKIKYLENEKIKSMS